MKDFVIVSAYTLDTGYEEEVQNLIASCKKVGIKEQDIVGFESRGSWERNCQFKAEHIKASLEKYKKPVVWIDADAVFRKYPDLFHNLDCDIAAHTRPESPRIPVKSLLSGTVYLDYTQATLNLVDDWITANQANARVWDQKSLQALVFGKHKTTAKFVRLPNTYCKIFDLMKDEVKEPVIEHFQASRRFKRKIGKPPVPARRPAKPSAPNVVHIAQLRKISLPADTLKTFFEDKSVVAVGNSRAVLKSDHSELIDSYDRVVRFNHGVPQAYVGKKTDLWVCNFRQFQEKAITEEFNLFDPKYIMRFGLGERKLFSEKLASKTHFVDGKSQLPLLAQFKTRGKALPSTGIRTIYYMLNELKVKHIDLVGFDFFKTGTWYNRRARGSVAHDGGADRRYVETEVASGRITIL